MCIFWYTGYSFLFIWSLVLEKMAASLTRQVRLGFSLGWRIWTPNEVGFYAKTLAHSYFILMILTSKFLKQKVWIVNYTLIAGIMKYYVFVEFLKFGLKTKEERSYWKKIIYITLVTRHRKYKSRSGRSSRKKFYRAKSAIHRFKIKVLALRRKNLSKKQGLLSSQIMNAGVKYTYRNFKKVNANFLSSYNKFLFENEKKVLKVKITGPRGGKMDFGLGRMSNLCSGLELFGRISKFKKNTNKFKNLLNYTIVRKLNTDGGKLKPMVGVSNFKIIKFSNYKKNIASLGLVNSNFLFKKLHNINFSVKKMKIKKDTNLICGLSSLSTKRTLPGCIYKKTENWLKKVEMLEEDVDIVNRLFLNTIMLKEPRKYSVAGGPRKRMSRNLKRAFKSIAIKKLINVIWFWEKVSRLVTFYVANLKLGY